MAHGLNLLDKIKGVDDARVVLAKIDDNSSTCDSLNQKQLEANNCSSHMDSFEGVDPQTPSSL